jgi:probable F420-dependent oxidoreductase
MKLCVAMSLVDIGGDPDVVRDFAMAAEDIGYDGLAVADHVLGVNTEGRPDWGVRATSATLYHDPFVIFGFLAPVTRVGDFSTQVLVLPQRQTALVAKQAACVDVLTRGRFRLGIGIGWNEVEFQALNEDFHNRGRRSEEQIDVMKALWAEPHVKFRGRWHTIDDAGINPLPTRRAVPLWFGGHADVVLHRIARWGDGWMIAGHPPGETAAAEIAKLRRYAETAGRDPAAIGIDVRVAMGTGAEAEWRDEARFWKGQGATHLTLATYYGQGHHRGIADTSMRGHLAAIRRYHDAVADLLG